MGDLDHTRATIPVELIDEITQLAAAVELINGKNRLLTSGLVQIEELLGEDRFASTWSKINVAGNTNDTITFQFGANIWYGAINDIVVTITATEAGDVLKIAKLCIDTLNANVQFKEYFKARSVLSTSFVYIGAKIPYIAEAGERDTYQTVVTGAVTVIDYYPSILMRGKVTSLTADPRDPRSGILGISGTVTSIPGAVGDLVIEKAINGSTPAMNINGSITPVTFCMGCHASKDKLISELRFYGTAAGIKFGQFLNVNVALTKGIEIKIKSDDAIITLPLIKSTEDFQSIFALGQIGFQYYDAAGLDPFLATFKLETPIPIRKTGTFPTDDYIQVKIQDNLTAIAKLEFLGYGFKQEA